MKFNKKNLIIGGAILVIIIIAALGLVLNNQRASQEVISETQQPGVQPETPITEVPVIEAPTQSTSTAPIQ